MDTGIIFDYAWRILTVFILVFLNGFFVAAEFALVKVRDTQLNGLIAKGQKRAVVVQKVIKNLDASLSACQLGITLASLGLGWVGEPVFAKLLEPVLSWLNVGSEWKHWISFMVGFSAITFMHITAGEQAPKWFAIQKPLATSLWVAVPLEMFHKASWPFIWLLNHASQWLLRQVGVDAAGESEHTHSEEELRLLISTTHKDKTQTSVGRDIVLNAFDLKWRVAREAMRPRKEITPISTDAAMAECLELAEKTRYSRFPLCEEGNIDKTLGVIHIKDLYAVRKMATSGKDLLPLARKLIYVPPGAHLEKILKLFLERKLHMAIVVDEYGGTLGLLTLENILEELVGQIQDEYDQEKPLLIKLDEATWAVDGSLPLHELSELVGEPLSGENIATASGWITQRLGGFPRPGVVISFKNFELTVTEMDGPRVAGFKLKKSEPPSP